MLEKIDSLPIISAPFFKDLDWLSHGFGLKEIAVEKYLKALGICEAEIPSTKQVHGHKIHCLTGKEGRQKILEGDGFLTDQPQVVCVARTADCLPVLMVDVKNRAVGAVHTGWRGTVEKIVVQAIDAFKNHWKSSLQNLKIALGPAIGGHCYRVGADVVKALKEAGLYPGPWIEERDRNQWYLDIAFANMHLLEKAGVPKENIYISLACTVCDPKKFRSFRRDGIKEEGQVNFIVKIKN